MKAKPKNAWIRPRQKARRLSRAFVQRPMLAISIGTVVWLLCIELVAHWFVRPSDVAYGRLLDVDLPPPRIIREGITQLQDPAEPFEDSRISGGRVTVGDLWGIYRLDSETGYTYEENARSVNGWWQSNNLGARVRLDTSPEVIQGRLRVLVFGDSFAHGSRVPQESAWPSVMAAQHPELDVVNFGVDGYSMAQALLRFRHVRRSIRYDIACLLFVPEVDLWRDINTLRQLVYPSWEMPLAPRFAVDEKGGLRLVRPLYPDPFDLFRLNSDHLTPALREYLRADDRFYFPRLFDETWLMRRSIFYKLTVRAMWADSYRRRLAGLMNPDGEAVRVTKGIADSMQRDSAADGTTFVLIILPVANAWWDGSARESQLTTWQKMVAFVCRDQPHCIDLRPGLARVPQSDLDRAYDGEHFGPKVYQHIANLIYQEIETGLVHGAVP